MIVFNLFIYNICNGIQMLSIGVIGNGFVGKVTNVLRCDAVDILFYDLDPKLCVPVGTTMEDIVKCDLIFVSVPTPMNKDGSPYLKIVESYIIEMNE